ncbi:MAG: hypothetical protein Q7K42_05810, partial [Candidatus Diapherotrites archaeon]|nr:hypothetical protein [Candidatus Diapherotrites archaeon]
LKESDKDFSSLNVVDYYDAVKNLLLGLLLVKGFSVKGEGAHFELINFVSEHYPKILTNEIHIIDNVRKYRNRISYEGYSIDSDYLERNEEKIKKLIEKLKELLEDVIGKN